MGCGSSSALPRDLPASVSQRPLAKPAGDSPTNGSHPPKPLVVRVDAAEQRQHLSGDGGLSLPEKSPVSRLPSSTQTDSIAPPSSVGTQYSLASSLAGANVRATYSASERPTTANAAVDSARTPQPANGNFTNLEALTGSVKAGANGVPLLWDDKADSFDADKSARRAPVQKMGSRTALLNRRRQESTHSLLTVPSTSSRPPTNKSPPSKKPDTAGDRVPKRSATVGVLPSDDNKVKLDDASSVPRRRTVPNLRLGEVRQSSDIDLVDERAELKWSRTTPSLRRWLTQENTKFGARSSQQLQGGAQTQGATPRESPRPQQSAAGVPPRLSVPPLRASLSLRTPRSPQSVVSNANRASLSGKRTLPTASSARLSFSARGARKTALVVEDVKVTQRLTCAALYTAGFVSDVASDGKTAAEMAARNQYNVILMDVQLPGMSGIEATQAIRLSETARAAPRTVVLALTVSADATALEAYRKAGMNGCVEKGCLLATAVPDALQSLETTAASTPLLLQATPSAKEHSQRFVYINRSNELAVGQLVIADAVLPATAAAAASAAAALAAHEGSSPLSPTSAAAAATVAAHADRIGGAVLDANSSSPARHAT